MTTCFGANRVVLAIIRVAARVSIGSSTDFLTNVFPMSRDISANETDYLLGLIRGFARTQRSSKEAIRLITFDH